MKLFLEKKDLEGAYTGVDSKKRVLEGYLAKFNNKDSVGDVIHPTAFNKTLQERKDEVWFLWQHDWRYPHAKSFAELYVDSYGLKYVSHPLPNTTFSNDTLELVDRKIIDKNSIGFEVTKFTGKKDVDRQIYEMKLYEGSTVTLAANDGAMITDLKSLTMTEVKEKEKAILKAFRNGTFTDETFTLLEIALKELQLQSYELGRKEALAEPSNDTQEKAAKVATIELLSNFKF